MYENMINFPLRCYIPYFHIKIYLVQSLFELKCVEFVSKLILMICYGVQPVVQKIQKDGACCNISFGNTMPGEYLSEANENKIIVSL